MSERTCEARRVHPISSDFYCPCSLSEGHEPPHSTEDGVTWTDDSPYAIPAPAVSADTRLIEALERIVAHRPNLTDVIRIAADALEEVRGK